MYLFKGPNSTITDTMMCMFNESWGVWNAVLSSPKAPRNFIIPFRLGDTRPGHAWDTGILLGLSGVQKALIILQVLTSVEIREAWQVPSSLWF